MHEKNKTEIHLGKLHRTIFPFSLECDEAEKKPLRQQLMALDDLLTTWAMYFPVYEADSVSPGKAVQCLQYSASNVGTSIIQQLFFYKFLEKCQSKHSHKPGECWANMSHKL